MKVALNTTNKVAISRDSQIPVWHERNTGVLQNIQKELQLYKVEYVLTNYESFGHSIVMECIIDSADISIVRHGVMGSCFSK